MPDPVTLHGYRLSVYTRAARMALCEKGVAYETVEVDPFAPDLAPAYFGLHPFGRVPVLRHGDFVLYETAAILRYVDAGFPGPGLTPAAPAVAARMTQVGGIVDSYGYWPLVRQTFSHAVGRPMRGVPGDPAEIAAGLAAAPRVLAALEAIAAEGLVLNGDAVTLADCHLAPMLDYFTRAEAGAAMLAGFPALARWFAFAEARASYEATAPDLSTLGASPD